MLLEKAIIPGNYKNYVFDLYGTLVDIHTDENSTILWEKLSMFMGYYAAIYEADELKTSYEQIVKGFENSYVHEAFPEIDIYDVFEKLYTDKGIEPTRELVEHTAQFFRILSTEYVKTYPGTREMLTGLKEQGKQIYLLSNAQRLFTAFEMNRIEILDLFNDVLISSDYKTKKPDRKFFDILIKKHNIKPEETLFIGNDSKTDIAGARMVGFNTFYVNSNISPQGDSGEEADYIVENFEKWETIRK